MNVNVTGPEKQTNIYSPFSADVQRENLRTVHPGDAVDRGAEDEHEEKEKGDGGRCRWLFDGCSCREWPVSTSKESYDRLGAR
jgi:hypothetical protein